MNECCLSSTTVSLPISASDCNHNCSLITMAINEENCHEVKCLFAVCYYVSIGGDMVYTLWTVGLLGWHRMRYEGRNKQHSVDGGAIPTAKSTANHRSWLTCNYCPLPSLRQCKAILKQHVPFMFETENYLRRAWEYIMGICHLGIYRLYCPSSRECFAHTLKKYLKNLLNRLGLKNHFTIVFIPLYHEAISRMRQWLRRAIISPTPQQHLFKQS